MRISINNGTPPPRNDPQAEHVHLIPAKEASTSQTVASNGGSGGKVAACWCTLLCTVWGARDYNNAMQ